jgi:tetratricopeptide (TPR) repeat protein
MNLEDNERAVVYLKKAFALNPNFDTARSLFVTLLKMDQPEAALPYLNYAVAGNGVSISLNRLTSFVAQVIALKRQYAADPGNAELANQIAATYLQFANTAAAAKYVERSLLLAQNNPNALQLQAQIREIQN